MVYQLSDGKTTREINANGGPSIGTVSNYWSAWYKLGLVKKILVKGKERYVKSFNLEDYNIKVLTVQQQNNQQINDVEDDSGGN